MATIIRADPIDLAAVPDGTYHGTWSGYEVLTDIHGVMVPLITDVGIRSPQTACLVTASGGQITVHTVQDSP